ncbi:hypothetical protein BC938DRAFT_484008 [Jimgerdemannia flammicorona]|uniref:Zn(2)-C6 fungal-type domain-containing protein n=1 Tax=Jimgerdemannia flammicorona TaxID=994334 RepID=A0A433QAX3_9FUNG|nr:hypothetical protein BC938DRAFT_484008 [Jimgerdemannia flammicorona]
MDLDQAKPLGAIDLSVKATPYPPAKPRLKTSCLICRAKKIRCDGEKPCSRCKTRGAECIYRESTGQVGRPPKNAVLNKMVSQRPKGSTQNIFVLENLNWSSVRESSALFNGYVSSTFGQANPDQPKIIERLMNIYTSFFRQFRFSDLPPNVLEDSDNNYPLVSVRNASLGFVYLQEVSSVIMMCDAVQLIVSKISSLPVDTYGRLKYYPQNIANDTSTSFSDQMPQPIVSMPNPIKALTPQQALQLIDTFFYLHPFSIILNKTLVLQNFWTDTGDPLLYSAIFASASLLSKIREFKQSQRPGDLFLAHAYSIISTSTTQNTLSKLQAFIILAWHENMVDNGKKGEHLVVLK